MQIKPDSLFTEYDLTPEEETVALNNPYLLAYLQTKRAAYAADFMTAQLHQGVGNNVDVTTSLIQLEQQRAKLAILTELIDEVVAVQSSEPEDEMATPPTSQVI